MLRQVPFLNISFRPKKFLIQVQAGMVEELFWNASLWIFGKDAV